MLGWRRNPPPPIPETKKLPSSQRGSAKFKRWNRWIFTHYKNKNQHSSVAERAFKWSKRRQVWGIPCQLWAADKLPMPGSASFQTEVGGREERKGGGKEWVREQKERSRNNCWSSELAEKACGLRSAPEISSSSLYFYNLKRSAIIKVIMSAFPQAPASGPVFKLYQLVKRSAEVFSSWFFFKRVEALKMKPCPPPLPPPRQNYLIPATWSIRRRGPQYPLPSPKCVCVFFVKEACRNPWLLTDPRRKGNGWGLRLSSVSLLLFLKV